jgi:hypothetical protein
VSFRELPVVAEPSVPEERGRGGWRMSRYAKQSVIVKKSSPKAKTLAAAKAIAKKYADRIYTSRTTSTSYRFRQRPPSDFKKGSFKTLALSKHISLVYGILKEKT